MATISVTVFVDNNEVNVVGGGGSGSRIDVEEGDVLSIFHNAFLSSGGSITASGFDTSRWTSSSNLVIAEGATGTRTIKSNPTNGAENITLSESGSVSGTIFLNIVGDDTTPDSFSIGANRTANPSQVTYFDTVTVTGINTPVTASATNGEVALQSGTSLERTFGSSKTVSLNDVVLTRSSAPSGYGQSKTVTLNIGGVTDSATLSTPSDPTSGTQINLGIASGPIDMDSILDLFMGQSQSFWGYTRPTDMGSLYRSGSYVPNISANSSVATSGAITLGSFYGSATSFYVASVPNNKIVFIDTSGGGSSFTGNCYWELGVDWDVGYGVGQRYNCEVYYSVTQNIGSVTFNGGSGSYSINNKSISITATANANTESFNSGTITVYYRSLVDPSVTGTTTMNYAINFFGP
tara:strand:- start:1807 stop:3030 length:1224 start_codon:yes stop_codon:yes gene_type:complete